LLVQEDMQKARLGKRRRLRAAAAGIAAFVALGAAVVGASAASASTAEPAGAGSAAFTVNDIKSVVPTPVKDYRIKFVYYVKEGTQTYKCLPTGTWDTASTPEATLDNFGPLPSVHHYGGPRWTAKDGSTLLGTVVNKAPQTGTIPWLLLSVTHEVPGGQLGDITNISRVFTQGGVGPTGACSAGETKSVPYGADYVFWAHR
jgi:hypothetical protein